MVTLSAIEIILGLLVCLVLMYLFVCKLLKYTDGTISKLEHQNEMLKLRLKQFKDEIYELTNPNGKYKGKY